MQLARRSLNDPERLIERERSLDAHIVELIAEAADAGYSTAEVLIALRMVCEHQHSALAEDPDPADDPA